MGIFDILNMRLNGYDFHVDLMAGDESWTDPRVKTVFEAWNSLTPYLQAGALGRDWQEAAQAVLNKEAAMYFLGTFAGEQIGAHAGEGATQEEIAAIMADTDFFPFPVFGTEFDAEMGIDAPIDDLVMAAEPGQPRERQGHPGLRRHGPGPGHLRWPRAPTTSRLPTMPTRAATRLPAEAWPRSSAGLVPSPSSSIATRARTSLARRACRAS